MSDYFVSNEDFENKLSLVVRKPQEGKTFICISSIVGDKSRNIHIVLTMNTLASGMQFFSRMEDQIGPENIIVFNSKKETAGKCLHAKSVTKVLDMILSNPAIKVVVCCAHEKRIRECIIQLFKFTSDSMKFAESNRRFTVHIDEAHKYIPENQSCIREYNASPIVNSIIGYSGTPDGIWSKNTSDPLFHKILIRDIEAELQIIRSPDYFGVNRCVFHILEEEMTHDDIVSIAKINESISSVVFSRAYMKPLVNTKPWYGPKWRFQWGNEILLLSYVDGIIPKLQISPDSFSYHFVPAYTRKATHYEMVDILLKHCPTANVITVNGNGFELYRISPSDKRSYRVKVGKTILQMASPDKRKWLGEPSNMVQEFIKDNSNCPTFVTGFTCIGMSVTLINSVIGNFDNVIMAHQHYSRDELYQLCRFLFNYTSWTPTEQSRIKTTQFYSLTKSVVDTCLEYEENVEHMCTEFSGKTCSLREIRGLGLGLDLAPEEPSAREQRTSALESLKLVTPSDKIWKKFKVYDGNEAEVWKMAITFYEKIKSKKLNEKSKSMPKCIDGFYHCSTTKGVEKQSITACRGLDKQRWWSTLQLTSTNLSLARIFVGYDQLDDPSEYTIFIKNVQLEDSVETRQVLEKYGKKNIKKIKTGACSDAVASGSSSDADTTPDTNADTSSEEDDDDN